MIMSVMPLKNSTRLILATLCLTMLLGTSGCANNDMTDLQNYVSEVKKRPPGAVEPLPMLRPAETFIFNGEGLRDPFKPISTEEQQEKMEASNGLRPDMDRPRRFWKPIHWMDSEWLEPSTWKIPYGP